MRSFKSASLHNRSSALSLSSKRPSLNFDASIPEHISQTRLSHCSGKATSVDSQSTHFASATKRTCEKAIAQPLPACTTATSAAENRKDKCLAAGTRTRARRSLSLLCFALLGRRRGVAVSRTACRSMQQWAGVLWRTGYRITGLDVGRGEEEGTGDGGVGMEYASR